MPEIKQMRFQVTVEGDRGSGKTFLLQELAKLSSDLGFDVVGGNPSQHYLILARKDIVREREDALKKLTPRERKVLGITQT